MHYHYDKHNDSKKIASFLVLLLAFSCLVIFALYGDSIIDSGNFKLFMTLVFVAMGLFTGLLYLVNKETKAPKSAKTANKKKK